jgi:subtilisin-like proprotein convertase family protein
LQHTVVEVAIHVADALAQVDVASLTVALSIEQGSPKDGDVAVSLKCELDVLGGMSEALAIPDEVA